MDNSSGPGFDDEPPPEPRDGWLLVRIHVPELNVYKCLQFPSDRLVWDVKQQVLASLPKELKESFNYGLFCPPSNGKAGKFLDEERRLGEYPFNGPVGYLELKYKRRVYKMLNLDERQLKSLHTRANLRRFLECINGGHVEKIAKMCAKGLDPNFHCPDSGETPLTVATGAKKPNKLLIALVNGGAILDYRTKDGTTALHRAVEKDSLEAVTTLLELGASPNYKDGRGITPLYISITRKGDSKITETLLHDHAMLGVQDNQGWNEVHQACRHGLIQHLEHLLFYGADMDAQNASGNTPLHVCAVNNQEACARMLLFRGAQRGALNYANQTPYQVAVIAGNMELAEVIQNYKSEDVVPFRGPPRYNPKRRSGTGWLHANECASVGSSIGSINRNSLSVRHGPPSPCPSEHLPYSSASSSLSEGSSGHRSHEDDISIVTDKSLGDASDIISDSSGVGTNSDSAACSIGHPSTTVICMESYSSNAAGHIRLKQGDVIEVVGSTDCGLLEGYVRGTNQSGFFPAENVQEISLRQKNVTNVLNAAVGNHSSYQHSTASSLHQGSPQLSVGGSSGIGGSNNGTLARKTQSHRQSPSLSLNSASSSIALNGNHNSQTADVTNLVSNSSQISHYNSATAPRIKKPSFNEPRTVVLHRAKRGFGFILRGAKASSQLMQLKPSERFPALQYLDDVDPGGVADMAGLHPGDFLLAINGEDVRAASHEKVVEMIRSAGALVSMTVISPQFPNQMQPCAAYSPINHISSGPNTPQTTHRQCATLPRKMSMGPSVGGRLPAPMPPRRDPKTTLSVGRARAKSMVAGLENGGEKDDNDIPHCKSSSVESVVTPTHPGTPVQLRTASIKARPTSSRITAAELEELFQRQQGEAVEGANRYSTMMTTSRFQSGIECGIATPPTTSASPIKGPLVYASVAEMKRKTKIKNGTLRGKPCAIPTIGGRDLKRFHSTPDLISHANSNSSIWQATGKNHHSQDDVATLHASLQRLNTNSSVLPPPNHPPPPPPIGQVVKVETRSNTSEYESTISLQEKLKKRAENDAVTSAAIDGIQSSFNPLTNAKIYASPQELRNVVAWKLRQTQEIRQNGQKELPITQANLSHSTNNDSTVVSAQTVLNEFRQSQLSHYSQPLINKPEDTDSHKPQYAPPQEVCAVNANGVIPTGPAPPIPEPDYSLSESDGEDENSILVARNTKLNEKIALIDVPVTTPNNSNSGNGNGSTNISHSLSVEEIKRIRSNLKTSKSSPNGFIKSADGSSGNAAEVNAVERTGANEEDADNSSSGVSSDLEVGAGGGQKLTDTIKKKPNVTIIEETTASNQLNIPECQNTTTFHKPPATESDATDAAPRPVNTDIQTPNKAFVKSNLVNANDNIKAVPLTTNTATVTVKQMVQQQHAPVIQQQQQQQIAETKLKGNVVQSQQPTTKLQSNIAVRGAHVQQKVPSSPSRNDAHAQNNTTKVIAAQHQLLQQPQQQITHQQHLQQILKAKSTAAAASAKNTATIVTKQQQQLHRGNVHAPNIATLRASLSMESEQDQRSDDDGELSPSPPAKAFQRHNSLTRKQAAAIAMQRASRHSPAVSLIQLPPPIEADIDNDGMGYVNNPSGTVMLQHSSNVQNACPENIVLAPPPQFCDCNDAKHSAQLQQQYQQHHQQQQQRLTQAQFVLVQQQQQMHHHQQQQQQQQQINTALHYVSNTSGRVRIVGAIPKTSHRTH